MLQLMCKAPLRNLKVQLVGLKSTLLTENIHNYHNTMTVIADTFRFCAIRRVWRMKMEVAVSARRLISGNLAFIRLVRSRYFAYFGVIRVYTSRCSLLFYILFHIIHIQSFKATAYSGKCPSASNAPHSCRGFPLNHLKRQFSIWKTIFSLITVSLYYRAAVDFLVFYYAGFEPDWNGSCSLWPWLPGYRCCRLKPSF